MLLIAAGEDVSRTAVADCPVQLEERAGRSMRVKDVDELARVVCCPLPPYAAMGDVSKPSVAVAEAEVVKSVCKILLVLGDTSVAGLPGEGGAEVNSFGAEGVSVDLLVVDAVAVEVV